MEMKTLTSTIETVKTCKYVSTQESRNFAKVCRLFVDLLRDVLWEALTKRILPDDLPEKVRQNKSRLEMAGRMTDDQYKKICKPGGGKVSYEDFDISLLYMLLRNLPMEPKILSPSNNWGLDIYPNGKQIREADDIERIRITRNQVLGHFGRASLSKDEFDKIWTEMQAVVKRFDDRLKTDFKSDMEVILKDEMSPRIEEDYMNDFEKQKEYDLETRQLALEAREEAVEAKKLATKCLEQADMCKEKLAKTERKVDDLEKDAEEKKKDAERGPTETLKVMLERTRRRLEEWKSEKAYFHATKDFNQVKDLLMKKAQGYTIFISGHPGEGKTTFGHMLLLEMQTNGKKCVILNEPGEAMFVTTEHVDIIIVDDIFGTVTYDNYRSGLWKHYYDDFKKWKMDKKVSFIFTSRELNVKECKRSLDEEDLFDKDGKIVLSSEHLKPIEKTEILSKQLKRNKGKTLRKEEIKQCCAEFTNPFGFPLCCKLFANSHVYFKQKSKFFSRPLKALEEEIEHLWNVKTNKSMFVALAAVWMSDISKEGSELDLLHGIIKFQRRLCFPNFNKLCNVVSSLNICLFETIAIDELFEKLNRVYLIHHKQSPWQREGGYAFSHEVIEEAFGRVLTRIKQDVAIQYGSIEFLVKNTCTMTSPKEDQESLKIPVDKDLYDKLFQRLVKSLMNIDDNFIAVHHAAFEDSNFLDFFLKKASGTKELEELIAKRRSIGWGFTRTSFLKEALEQDVPKIELVRRILEEKHLDQIHDKRWVQEQKQSMFSAACRLGSIAFPLYTLLVEEGVAVTSDSFIRATGAGSREIVEDLFQRVGVNQEHSINDKCLVLASQRGFLDLVKLFVEKGANIETQSHPIDGTPLYQAIFQEHIDVSLFLIDKGANVETFPKRKIHNSCLHTACRSGQTRVVDALLQKNVQIDIKNKNGVTPLHFALLFEHEDIAKKLIQKGCDINLRSGRLEKTPLHISSEKGLVEITQILLKKGIYPMAKDKKGHSPMHYASMNGHRKIVLLLMKENADQSESRSLNHRRKKDIKGMAPIHYAARIGRVDVVTLLIESGVDANLPDMYGRSPLYLAAWFGHQEVVDELLKVATIDVNCKETKYGFTALHIATDRRHAGVVDKLCQHRVTEVNLPDKVGRTALHIASVHGDKLIIKLLLQFQADMRCLTENCDTPLHLFKNAEVAEMLLVKDRLVMNLKNRQGISPFEIAKYNSSDVLKVFEKYKVDIEEHHS